MVKCKNIECNNEIEQKKMGRKKYFCCGKCWDRHKYLNNREEIIKRSAIWTENNRERAREINRKALTKFRTEKPNRFKELMKRVYERNKGKSHSRRLTLYLRERGEIVLKRTCKCGKRKGLQIHHTTYPTTAEHIKTAVAEGLIYHLCPLCHNLTKRGVKRNT